MVAVHQMVSQVNQELMLLTRRIASLFSFVGNKLGNFTRLTLKEQIAYGLAAVGLLLIITSGVLFLL